ncbi:MAG: monofunctional biosynthetic peptidoglycan transglycosylase [Deltaproteobacteria bacterium]|nr:monofunctional biosynthetic peptidoglycan transglycosylase [Deltaproteobacteria bacterium]
MAKEKSLLKRIPGLAFRILITLALIFILVSAAQVLFVRFFNPSFTVSVAGLWIKNLFASEDRVIPRHNWRELKDISPSLIKAVMAGEDQRFISHHGFDFVEMNKAYQDILKNRRTRGASTITMQLARTLFLWKGRNPVRKVLEAYYTVLLEVFLSKTRIMELYLNTVDWGTGIQGAEAAALKYYNTGAGNLTDNQAAGLAAILPNPHDWSPTQPNRSVMTHREHILRYMGDMRL